MSSIIARDQDRSHRPITGAPNQVCGELERGRVLARVYAILLDLAEQAPVEAELEAGDGDAPELIADREPVGSSLEAGTGGYCSN